MTTQQKQSGFRPQQQVQLNGVTFVVVKVSPQGAAYLEPVATQVAR